MTHLLLTGALLCTAAAVVSGLLVGAATRQLHAALPVLLELLLAAGLLRLSAGGTWTGIATAVVIVAVRKVAGVGIRTARGAAHVGPQRFPLRRVQGASDDGAAIS